MKKIAIFLLLAICSITSTRAQYGYIEPRNDYMAAFDVKGQNITWQREWCTTKPQNELYAEIAQRITITTIVDNLVIGRIEDAHFGAGTAFSDGRLPWDGSSIKANVIYELTNVGYIVKVSNIMYLCTAISKSYLSIYGIIFNSKGDLRNRGDGDLRYFDNAFCDLLLIE